MTFKHFKHLNVPDGWERYFTKYPQGMTILEALFEWVSQVDSMVDNINMWNEYLDNFVATFDKELQNTVTDTLSDWQNSGFLDVVISEALQWELDNYIAANEQDKLTIRQEVAETDTKHSKNQPLLLGGNVSNKLIYRVGTHLFVVSKKPHGNGYVRFRLREDLVDTSATSAGGTGNLLRVVEVFNTPECFSLVKTGTKSPTGWGDDASIYYGSVQIPLYSANATVAGTYVDYDVVVPSGKYMCELLVYGSTGSSQDVNISVDGVVARNVSFKQNTAKWIRVGVPCTPGSHTIRVTINDAGYGSIAGANIVDLNDFKGENYDTVYTIYEGSVNQYITNGGAIDYAMQSADDDLYYGSYHGGEVRQSIQYLLDGTTITPVDGGYYIGKQFEVLQTTLIKMGALIANSRYIFKYDGIQEFEVDFSGSMNLTRLFTNMCTTHQDYNLVISPKKVITATDGNYYFDDGVNKIVQMNEANNQRIASILNNVTYPQQKTIQPYVQKSQYYNKVYRENIKDDNGVIFTGGNFYSAHIFE